MRRHVPAQVPRRHLESLAPATLLEVSPLRLVQAPVLARHVRNAVVEEAPRQACRSAAQTTQIFIPGLPAHTFPLKSCRRIRRLISFHNAYSQGFTSGLGGGMYESANPLLRRQRRQSNDQRDGRWTKSCTTYSYSRGSPPLPPSLILTYHQVT